MLKRDAETRRVLHIGNLVYLQDFITVNKQNTGIPVIGKAYLKYRTQDLTTSHTPERNINTSMN